MIARWTRQARVEYAARANVIWTVLATGAITASALVAGVVLARNLGPSGRGSLAVLVAWSLLAIDLALFGSRQATVFFVARTDGSERGRMWKYVRHIAVLEGLAGLALFVLIFGLRGASGLAPLAAIAIFAAKVPVQVLLAHRSSYLQGTYNMMGFNVVRLLAGAGPLIVFLALSSANRLTITTASVAYFTAILGAAAVGFYLVGRLTRNVNSRGQTSRWQDGRAYWRYSAKSFASIVAARGNLQVDLLVLSLFAVSAASLGYYAVAGTAGLLPAMVGASIGMVAFPKIAIEGTVARQRSMVNRAVLSTVVISSAIAIPIALLSEELVGLVYGEAFLPAAALVRVLAIGGVALSVSLLLADVLRALNRVGVVAVGEGAGFLVTLTGVVLWQVHGNLHWVAGFATAGFVVAVLVMGMAVWNLLYRLPRSQ